MSKTVTAKKFSAQSLFAQQCVDKINAEFKAEWEKMDLGEVGHYLMQTWEPRETDEYTAFLWISGETGSPMVDYYDEFNMSEKWMEKLNALLKPKNMYLEWQNPGLLGVFPW